jgi:hypothetical protein
MKAERRRKFLRLATGAAVIPALPRVARAQTELLSGAKLMFFWRAVNGAR